MATNPAPAPEPAPAAAEQALLRRLGLEPRAARERPADLAEALDHCSRQFQLWEVQREVIDDAAAGRVKREPVVPPRGSSDSAAKGLMDLLPSSLGATAGEATRALARFAGASVLARKGFTGYRALRRLALTKPYKPAERE